MIIENYYSDILLAAWTLLYFFGGYLLLGKIPEKHNYDIYRRSSKILGVALLFFGLQIFLQWLFQFRSSAPHVAAALNLSCFYLEALLFGMSFISLLDRDYLTPKLVKTNSIKWSSFEVVLWSSVLFFEGTARSVMLILLALFFLADASRIALLFFSTYHKALKQMNNYYSDNVDGFVLWLSKSTYGIVFFGLIASVLAFAPKWIVALYTLLGIFMFIYIFSSFINYLVNYEQVKTAANIPLEEAHEDNNITMSQIEKELNRWTEEERFKQSGLTIEQLATDIGTNRTYLSSYINSVYKCTFREWIVGLRIEAAKQILRSDKNISIVQLAETVGFASSAHFSRLFSQHEGVAPTRWRDNAVNEHT